MIAMKIAAFVIACVASEAAAVLAVCAAATRLAISPAS